MRLFIKIPLIVLGSLAGLIVLAVLVYLILPKGPLDQMDFDDPYHQPRTLLEADEYAVVAGTPWAAEAARNILEQGGSAYDAAVGAVLMLNVTFGEAASFPGVAPVMIYDNQEMRVRSYIGAGTAPEKATLELFQDKGHKVVPDLSILAQLLPASPDVLIALLKEYGSMSFYQIVEPAVAMAEEGFPIHTIMRKNLDFSAIERIGFSIIMPSTAEYYLRGQWWRPLHYRDRFTRPELARTFRTLADVEKAVLEAGGSREEGLDAVRDYFYKGPIAEAIAAFHQQKKGLISLEDLSEYSGAWEKPVSAEIGAYTFYTNGTWSQGIVVPMALQMLNGMDLASMGHNSPAYIHTVVQAIDLCMADRERYVADQSFVDVPVETLVSPEYARQRRKVLQDSAFNGMPPAGSIPGYAARDQSDVKSVRLASEKDQLLSFDFAIGRDTSQVVVVDKQGNAVAVTPSDFPKSPMIPELGLNMGNRMVQFRLDPDHPAVLEPGKRPRITPHAVIVKRDGIFYMVYNTPGGDMQTQALIQVFLNMQVFGMDLQQAINAPRFRSRNFPDSFSPHDMRPANLLLEEELYDQSALSLKEMGYDVEERESWSNEFSAVGAIIKENGKLYAGSDPREATTALGK